MALSPDIKALLEDVYTFLKELDGAALQMNMRKQGNSLKARLEDLTDRCGSGDSADVSSTTSKQPSIIDEETYDDADVCAESAPKLPKPRTDPATSTASQGSIRRRKSHGFGSVFSASDETKMADISVASLVKDATIHGSLEKKRPDSSTLFKNIYQKRYCVIHNGFFYYYDKETDKKQKGAFNLKDYEARPAALKHPSKKEGAFELVALAQRSYQFVARDFDQMKQWISAVSQWSSVKHPPITSLTNQDGGSIKSVSDAAIEEVTYDEGGEVTPIVSANKRLPVIPTTAVDEEVYDDGGDERPVTQTSPIIQEEIYDDGEEAVNTISSEPVPVDEEIYDELGDEPAAEETYDDAGEDTSRMTGGISTAAQHRPLPTITPPRSQPSRPLPPPPDRPVISCRYDDYENQYYGVCDCDASLSHELSFKQGDIVHVVQKDYEDKGWWTALLDGKVGLVPLSYLTPAYQVC